MEDKSHKSHEPVLLEEVVSHLHIKSSAANGRKARYIDATLGGGGHAKQIVAKGGMVLGIDADRKMLKLAREELEEACPVSENFGDCFILAQGNFRDIVNIASRNHFKQVDGVLMDLGISSVHLDADERGFSFRDEDAPLDMRLDIENQAITGAQILNVLPKSKLAELFLPVTGYKMAHRLAERIIKFRKKKPFETVADLVSVSSEIYPPGKINKATKPFMALRIAVNSEMENLEVALPGAFSLLRPKGRLAVITFHSGEDRLVKRYFRDIANDGKANLVTKRPIVPSTEEVAKNKRARSAKLRVIEKL